MRIAFLAYDRPDYHAGPIVNARRLLPALGERGHQVAALLLYRKGAAPTADYLESRGVPCRVHPWQAYTEDNVRWILTQLSEINPDVFVPNISVPGYFAARWARQAGIPTVGAHRCDDEYHWAMVDQFVVGAAPWRLSGLVCVSQQLRQRVSALNPRDTQLGVIPSGVPLPPQPTARLSPLRLLYIGRLVERQKRIGRVVEAMTVVLNEYPQATAMIIGSGPEEEHVHQLVQATSAADRITVTGGVPPERLPEAIAGGSAIILLSDFEGTPGALMDAMAHGVVPLCGRIPGGVAELVDHETTGLVVGDKPNDVLAAVSRLQEEDGLWDRLSRQARGRIADGYSLASAAERWEQFLAGLLKDAGPRQPIHWPRRFGLPSVTAGLAREDVRCHPRWKRVAWRAENRSRAWISKLLSTVTVDRRTPILVYTMGKVGSSSIHRSLASANLQSPIFHVHFLDEERLRETEQQYRNREMAAIPKHVEDSRAARIYRERLIRCKTITLVREPVRTFLSHVFQNPHIHRPFLLDGQGKMVPSRVQSHITEALSSFDESTDYIAAWFDVEFQSATKVDVYDHPFDTQLGYSRIRGELDDILILRLEDLHDTFSSAITDFLACKDPIELTSANVNRDKAESGLYSEMRQSLSIPRDVLRHVYDSKYARHFYSDCERSALIEYWAQPQSRLLDDWKQIKTHCHSSA